MNKPRVNATSAEILDAVIEEIALDEAEYGRSCADDHRWSQAVGASVRYRLGELRRQLTPDDAPIEKAAPVTAWILALGRDALIEKITELTSARGGAMQFAHRDLTILSDDDLRRLLDLMERTAHDEV